MIAAINRRYDTQRQALEDAQEGEKPDKPPAGASHRRPPAPDGEKFDVEIDLTGDISRAHLASIRMGRIYDTD